MYTGGLVENTTETPMPEHKPPNLLESSLVKLASYVDVSTAELARACLATNGISARLSNDNLVSWFWHYSNATGGVKLLVMEEDIEKSRELLAARKRRPDGEPWTCEGCGERIEGGWDVCWSCGTLADGTGSRTFPAEKEKAAADNSEIAGLIVLGSALLFAMTGGSVMILGCGLLTLVFVLSLTDSRRKQAEHYRQDELAGRLPEFVLSPAGRLKRRRRAEVRELTQRAWRSSVLALFMFPPLAFYCLYLLYKIAPRRRLLGRRARRQYRRALAVAILAAVLGAVIVAAVILAGGIVIRDIFIRWGS